MQPDYHQILGISHTADLQEIQQATQTKINDIKTAFAVLSQTKTRTMYDANPNLGPHNHYATLLVKKLTPTAEIKAAAQARMKEIKEAYETLSKPETRAAYDSQWQATKAPIPHSPLIPLPPKMGKVVVEQKPVPPPDRDKSPVSSYRTSTVSLTNTESKAPEIELAGRGIRLLAVIADVLIIVVAYFLVVPIVPVIMINLVLLYRYSQTIGRRLFAIKIVNADGSRAELSRILCEFWLVKLSFIYLLIIIGCVMFIISLGSTIRFILDFIRKPSCLYNNTIAHTIEVRVFPGKNDTPYGSLAGVIVSSTLVMAVMFGLAAWGMINAYTDYLERSKVSLERGKVSEAIEFLNVQKGSAAESIAATGEFPLMGSILRLTSKTSGKNLASVVSNSKEFYFEATMSKEDSVLAGKTVRLIYHPKSKTWSCSAAYPNGIPPKYLPSVCQSSPAEINANLNSWRREEVSEAIQWLEELKTPTEQYLATKGKFPPTIDVLTKKTAGKYTANLVSNPQQFYFEATMNQADSVLAGKVVRLNYYPNTKRWSCSAAYPKGIPQIYLPDVCQSSDAEIIAITNPLKRDTLSRSKVSEAIQLLEALKKPVEQYMADKGKFPPAIELLALLSETDKASIKYTASIIPNPEEFYLEATLKKEGSVLAGNVVRLIYHPNTKTWDCSAAYPNGIPQQYLPDVCKSPVAIVAAATSADTDNLKIDKVLDAIQLLGELIKPAEQYIIATKGEFPPTIDVLTKKTTSKYTANLVSNPQQSYFEATMNQEDRVLAGKTVRLIYHPDTKTWRYSADYPNGIPLKYLPSVYKSPFTIVPKAPAPVTPIRKVAPTPKVPKAPPVKPGINILKCILRKGRC